MKIFQFHLLLKVLHFGVCLSSVYFYYHLFTYFAIHFFIAIASIGLMSSVRHPDAKKQQGIFQC
jgi:hypothetical protein